MPVDGYPTEEELSRIREWPGEQGLSALLAFVKTCWWAADWGWSEKDGKHGREYHVSTGGWSGNEDIIGALRENSLFWAMCWESSRRGGHFVFQVSKDP